MRNKPQNQIRVLGRPGLGALVSSLMASLALGCGSSTPVDGDNDNGANVDAAIAGGAGDASATPARIPSWTLEDINPTSDRFGETYGLDQFADRVLVVLLVQGF